MVRNIIIPPVICILLCLVTSLFSFSQGNFFSAKSKKKKIEILNKWSDAIKDLQQSADYKTSADYKFISESRPFLPNAIGCKDDFFKKYFGKTLAEFNGDELDQVLDLMKGDDGVTPPKELTADPTLTVFFLNDRYIVTHYPVGRRPYDEANQARALVKQINSPIIAQTSTTSQTGIGNIGSGRTAIGIPTVTGKETAVATCIGMKLIDATFEGKNKGFLVTDVQLGSAAYVAGIQPGDFFLSLVIPGGNNLVPLNTASDLQQMGCGSSYAATLVYNMLYKNPETGDYLPFSGRLALGPLKVNGPWVNTITGTSKPGNSSQVSTQYDNYGTRFRQSRQVRAISYQGHIWPDRPQFAGISDTISHYLNWYNTELSALKAEAAKQPCIFDDASSLTASYEQAAGRLDMYRELYIGASNSSTADAIKSYLTVRCTGEWWNIGNNRMTRAVRNLLADDEKLWKKHESTEMKADDWEKCVYQLFVSFENRYRNTCGNEYPEPIDTFVLHIDAMPDEVLKNGIGLELMRFPGRPATDYYAFARKKYSSAYIGVFNTIRRRQIYNLLTEDYSITRDAAYYVNAIFDKYGCRSSQVQQLEKQLFKGIQFLRPEYSDKYREEFRKYGKPEKKQ